MNDEIVDSQKNEKNLQESSRLCMEAFSKILDWIEYIRKYTSDSIGAHLATDKANKNKPKMLHPLNEEKTIYIPRWYAWILSKNEISTKGRKASDIPALICFFIVGIKTSKKWNLQIGYGALKNVKRTAGTFDTIYVSRELLDVVNAKRNHSDTIESSHAQGNYEVQWSDFFEYSSMEQIGELTEKINEKFESLLTEDN